MESVEKEESPDSASAATAWQHVAPNPDVAEPEEAITEDQEPMVVASADEQGDRVGDDDSFPPVVPEGEAVVEGKTSPPADFLLTAEPNEQQSMLPFVRQFMQIDETFHVQDLATLLLRATGLRIKLDARAIAPRDATPEVAEQFESSGFFAVDAAFIERFGRPLVVTTNAEDGKPVEVVLYDVGKEAFQQSLEENIDAFFTSLGFACHAYPGTIIITTPSRKEEVAERFSPQLYSVMVKYYEVRDPGLADILASNTGEERFMDVAGPGVFKQAGGSAKWKALVDRDDTTLLTSHAFTALDGSLWWYESSTGLAVAGEPHQLKSASTSDVPIYRSEGCCGCGMRKSTHGGPGVVGGSGTQTEVGLVMDASWNIRDNQNTLLFHQLFDNSRPEPITRGRRGGRRIDKGAGQDRPEQSPLVENTGIITGVSVAADGDPDSPYVLLYIQENLNHWDLEAKGAWRTIRGAGRLNEPAVYAWPTAIEGTSAMAIVSTEAI